ncbi:hypothetical protein LAUMK35_02564 [Mycobacterium pseudokansasii]|uniref:Uncharacterized protein n=1 Tax=Mycobacterium pseudokansasii TaxID=2341080 RepID=A0A498QS85_9MYCO|nr:hypothetical protein A4G27_26015 [Mycobacterium kansasii]VAZ94289.1 hypothetical protein LAUMK35_02564 [Mycobacterium pseudokansasii]VAZ95268.1 hypothetical protein LAUMK21_02564 [Mycobacterium pseudokansasii]VBA50203.1 hypothetical protein LAUMK142_02456 [Mycobacterium pseudokansasii]
MPGLRVGANVILACVGEEMHQKGWLMAPWLIDKGPTVANGLLIFRWGRCIRYSPARPEAGTSMLTATFVVHES